MTTIKNRPIKTNKILYIRCLMVEIGIFNSLLCVIYVHYKIVKYKYILLQRRKNELVR